jgi:hypothetical protein
MTEIINWIAYYNINKDKKQTTDNVSTTAEGMETMARLITERANQKG